MSSQEPSNLNRSNPESNFTSANTKYAERKQQLMQHLVSIQDELEICKRDLASVKSELRYINAHGDFDELEARHEGGNYIEQIILHNQYPSFFHKKMLLNTLEQRVSKLFQQEIDLKQELANIQEQEAKENAHLQQETQEWLSQEAQDLYQNADEQLAFEQSLRSSPNATNNTQNSNKRASIQTMLDNFFGFEDKDHKSDLNLGSQVQNKSAPQNEYKGAVEEDESSQVSFIHKDNDKLSDKKDVKDNQIAQALFEVAQEFSLLEHPCLNVNLTSNLYELLLISVWNVGIEFNKIWSALKKSPINIDGFGATELLKDILDEFKVEFSHIISAQNINDLQALFSDVRHTELRLRGLLYHIEQQTLNDKLLICVHAITDVFWNLLKICIQQVFNQGLSVYDCLKAQGNPPENASVCGVMVEDELTFLALGKDLKDDFISLDLHMMFCREIAKIKTKQDKEQDVDVAPFRDAKVFTTSHNLEDTLNVRTNKESNAQDPVKERSKDAKTKSQDRQGSSQEDLPDMLKSVLKSGLSAAREELSKADFSKPDLKNVVSNFKVAAKEGLNASVQTGLDTVASHLGLRGKKEQDSKPTSTQKSSQSDNKGSIAQALDSFTQAISSKANINKADDFGTGTGKSKDNNAKADTVDFISAALNDAFNGALDSKNINKIVKSCYDFNQDLSKNNNVMDDALWERFHKNADEFDNAIKGIDAAKFFEGKRKKAENPLQYYQGLNAQTQKSHTDEQVSTKDHVTDIESVVNKDEHIVSTKIDQSMATQTNVTDQTLGVDDVVNDKVASKLPSKSVDVQDAFITCAKLDRTLSQRRQEQIVERLESIQLPAGVEYPYVAVMGSSGAGKSTLCNLLLGANICKVCDYDIGTTTPEIHVMSLGGKPRISLVDLPGIGSGSALDDERIIGLYQQQFNYAKTCLWVINADRRDIFKEIKLFVDKIATFKKPNQGLLVVLNQVDKLSPMNWDQEHNCPSQEQLEVLRKIRERFAEQFNLPESKLIPISALRGYNVTRLINELSFIMSEQN